MYLCCLLTHRPFLASTQKSLVAHITLMKKEKNIILMRGLNEYYGSRNRRKIDRKNGLFVFLDSPQYPESMFFFYFFFVLIQH